MQWAAVPLRLAIAAIFALAGAAKLRDRSAFAAALGDFGVPPRATAPLSVAIPVLELLTAAGQLFAPTAVPAAGLGLGLLALFTAAVAANLVRGNRPVCNCFGQLRSTPISGLTLVRNVVFAIPAAALIAIDVAGPSVLIGGWLSALDLATVLVLALMSAVAVGLALVLWLTVNSMRLQGKLLLRVEALEAALRESPSRPGAPAPHDAQASGAVPGLPIGSTAPTFRLQDLSGETRSLSDVLQGVKAAMLVFIDPHCGPCVGLMADVATWQREHAGTLAIVPVSRGRASDNRKKASPAGVTDMLLQKDREVAQAYKCEGTPGSVIVTRDGLIATRLAMGADAIRAQVTQWARHANVPRVGDVAPPIRLTDLSNAPVSLADYAGQRTVVVFWNPTCGYCDRILPELRAWEVEQEVLAVLVVSSGTVEQNRSLRLRSRLVLDAGFAIGASYGAQGTPSAVLIDEDGRVASPLAVGGPAVLGLLEKTAASPVDVRTPEELVR